MSPRRLPRTLLFTCLLTVVPAMAFAQSGALQKRLAAATSLNCTFSQLATGTWRAGAPGADVKPATLTLTFTKINVDEGTADAESKFGGSYLVVRLVNEYLHLTQMHLAGPLYTTTVIAKETKDGRLMAVHTRHEYTDISLPGFTSRPEMYIGDCALQ
jgi:hypothetical protein